LQVGRVALIIVDQWLRRSPAAVAPPMRSRRRIPGGPGCRIENGHGCDKSPWSPWALRTKGKIHGRNDRWLPISTLAVQTRRLLMRMITDKQHVEQELRTPWRSKNMQTITPNQLVLKTQNVLKYGVVNVCDMYGKARSEHINVCGKGQWLVSDRLPGKCENCHHSKRTLPEFSKMTDAVLEKSFSYWQLQLLYLF